jgi:hypothetical protein
MLPAFWQNLPAKQGEDRFRAETAPHPVPSLWGMSSSQNIRNIPESYRRASSMFPSRDPALAYDVG